MKLEEYIQKNKHDFDDEKMSEKSTVSFENRLLKEFHTPEKGKLYYIKTFSMAASIAILICVGIWSYIEHSRATQEKQKLLVNLEDESVGTRLEGIYHFSDTYLKEDVQIINSLLKILHEDSNNNVKIATIDALMLFPSNEKIRRNLIEALGKEKEPLVQIKLINVLSTLREKRAQKPLKELIKSEETLPIVVNNATLAMNKFK
ncbi:MAG: HEAT repeat domain-containing protein [Cellulophaga sp.]